MGSKKSNSSSATTTNTQDNSAVAGNNAVALAAGASYSNQDWFMSSDTYAADMSDRSTTNSNNRWSDNSTNFLDASNRSVTATDSRNQAQSWYALDNSDRSVTASDDRSWYSYASDSRDLSTSAVLNDSSNRSVTNWTGTDPGVLQFNSQAGQLVGALHESNTDAIQFMTNSGADMVRRMGESATNLYSTAGLNNVQSWGQTTAAAERVLSGAADRVGAMWSDTLDKSAGLLGTITQRAANTADATIAAYQPPEAQQATTSRYVLLAVAGLAAVVILPRLLKA